MNGFMLGLVFIVVMALGYKALNIVWPSGGDRTKTLVKMIISIAISIVISIASDQLIAQLVAYILQAF